MNDLQFLVTVKVAVYADSGANAAKVVEDRLRTHDANPAPAGEDKHALLIHEINIARPVKQR